MVDDYWQRLKPHMDKAGMGISQLARALGLSFQAVAKVRDGGAFGSANNIKAAKLFGLNPEWLATGTGPRLATPRPPGDATQRGVARLPDEVKEFSFQSVTVPPLLTWGAAMQSKELPPEFALRMPDGALGDRVPEGASLIFRAASTARPRQCVLVEDASGQRYVRRYAQGQGTAWQAQALDDAYITLQSERDGLRILAVMAWRESSEI